MPCLARALSPLPTGWPTATGSGRKAEFAVDERDRARAGPEPFLAQPRLCAFAATYLQPRFSARPRRCFPSVGGDWSSSSPHSAGSRHRSPSAFATEMSRLRCRLSTVMSLVSFPIHHVGTPSIKPTALTYLGARAVQRKPKLKGWSHRPNPEDIKVRGVPVSSCPASLTSAARGACALKTWSTCNHGGLRPFHLQLVLARPNGLLANMA